MKWRFKHWKTASWYFGLTFSKGYAEANFGPWAALLWAEED